MKENRFTTQIGADRVIRPPQDVELTVGEAEVIVWQPATTDRPVGEPELPVHEHAAETSKDSPVDAGLPPFSFDALRERLARAAEELGIRDLPTDLAENHDHYAHGAPRGVDRR